MVVCDEHNHPYGSTLEGHPYAARLNEDEFLLVKELTSYNVQPRHILSTIKERNPDNVSSLRNVYNAQNKIRGVIRADRTPIQVLLSHLKDEGYVYYERVNEQTNKLEELFFVHQTSYAIWCTFPHIMIMDSTYNTTLFKLSFFEIVGFTSTNKTFSMGFSFLDKEKGPNFCWVLQCVKKVIVEAYYPRVIITGRDLFHHIPCITSIYNVLDDGNCGFRSVAIGIGKNENMWPEIRQNLLQELDQHEINYMAMWWEDGFQRIRFSVDHFEPGLAPRVKWMSMPNTWLVIATFYNRPVIFISQQQSFTCFPLLYGPNWSQPTDPIVILLVGGEHFINATLDENCSLPPTHPQWRRYKNEDASEWANIYSSRLM